MGQAWGIAQNPRVPGRVSRERVVRGAVRDQRGREGGEGREGVGEEGEGRRWIRLDLLDHFKDICFSSA